MSSSHTAAAGITYHMKQAGFVVTIVPMSTQVPGAGGAPAPHRGCPGTVLEESIWRTEFSAPKWAVCQWKSLQESQETVFLLLFVGQP